MTTARKPDDLQLDLVIALMGIVAVAIAVVLVEHRYASLWAPFVASLTDDKDVPHKDAFTAIASVSGVLWTGGLIALQIRLSAPHDRTETAAQAQAELDERGVIKGAMACLAFAMLAPIFVLFLHGLSLRLVALAFAAYYLRFTYGHIGAYRQAIRAGEFEKARASLLMFTPTAAMIMGALFPRPLPIAALSSLLLFLGFLRLSATLYRL